MTEEERIFQGLLFRPGAKELRDIKLRTHNLCLRYNQTFEDDVETRAALLRQIVGAMGEDGFIQGPVQFHYGTHTTIGKRFFGNFNLTIQDDARVTIGDDVNCGPNVTIVTPVHPLLPGERRQMLGPDGQPAHLCYARPVTIGNDVWLGANVVVTGGVRRTAGLSNHRGSIIGRWDAVIGAGSVVTRDIPPFSLAAGVPCRVIRQITEKDSMRFHPELLGGCAPIE